MTDVNLPYLNPQRDRRGKVAYWYVRRHGKRTRLPGAPLSCEFMDAYHAAVGAKPPPAGAARDAKGTFSALIAGWCGSAKFKGHELGT